MAVAKKTEGATLLLLRGRSYTLVHPFDRRKGAYLFKKGEPRPVRDPEVVEYARGLTETITDRDGEEITKPLFRITSLEAEQKITSSRQAARVSNDDDDDDRRPAIRPRRKL